MFLMFYLVSGWLKNEDKLRQSLSEMAGDQALNRTKVRKAEDPALDTSVFNWFVTQCAEGVPVSGPIVQAQAVKASKELHGEDHTFTATSGWLSSWKQRHGIHGIKISGDMRSGDAEAAVAFIPELQRLAEDEGLQPEQIYNTDETALGYKCCLTRPWPCGLTKPAAMDTNSGRTISQCF